MCAVALPRRGLACAVCIHTAVVWRTRMRGLAPVVGVGVVSLCLMPWCGVVYLCEPQSVIHRDLKGDNIFMSDGHTKLADFGLAATAASAGGQVGAYAYQSPEQVRGCEGARCALVGECVVVLCVSLVVYGVRSVRVLLPLLPHFPRAPACVAWLRSQA
jgi:serine/threonine protein kinase